MLWPLRLLYIERRSFHLIIEELFIYVMWRRFLPRRGWIIRRWSIFSIFSWAGFITFGIGALDSRVSLLQIGHCGSFDITFFLWCFRSWKKNPFEKTSHYSLGPNFRAFCTIFSEIWSDEFGLFADSWITFKTGDLGKIVITLSLSIGLKFRKKV